VASERMRIRKANKLFLCMTKSPENGMGIDPVAGLTISRVG